MQGVTRGASSVVSVNFDEKKIETTVTNEANSVSNWVQQIYSLHGRNNSTTIVGLDVEFTPKMVDGRPVGYRSATLQLCVDDKCLIIQLLHLDYIPETLGHFLSDTRFTFVGVEVGGDVKKLKGDYGFVCDNIADVRDVAKKKWPGRFSNSNNPGLKSLALEVAGLNMEKPRHITMSQWDSRILSDCQVEYACIDAYASYKIGAVLLQN